MLVNGAGPFLGSDRDNARARIAAALAQSAAATVRVEPGPVTADGTLVVRYDVRGVREKSSLNIALVERGIVIKVARGENRGKTLRHENVVRAMASVEIDGDSSGSIEIGIPRSARRENASLIAFIQSRSDMKIHAATLADLPTSATTRSVGVRE